MIRIGHTGSNTHQADVKLIAAPVLRRIAEENKNVQIVIGNDSDVYHMFDSVPETQKLFIPSLPYDVYPNFFAYVDILAVPLEDTPFTRAKSDIKLVECGATHTPYVASNLPFYSAWCDSSNPSGVVVENNRDAWYAALNSLIADGDLRNRLADAGYNKAIEERTIEKLAPAWETIING